MIIKNSLAELLAANNGQILTDSGLMLKQLDTIKIYVGLTLPVTDIYKYTAELRSDDMEIEEFVARYNIMNLGQLNQLSKETLWLHYQSGTAYVCFTETEWDIAICFRIINGCTAVYSRSLGYYNDTPEILTSIEHLENFLATENIN